MKRSMRRPTATGGCTYIYHYTSMRATTAPSFPLLLLRALLYQEWTVGAAPQQQLSVLLN